MKQVLLVAKETYIRQVKSWAFLFLVLAPFLTLLFSAGSGYLGSQFGSNFTPVAVVGQTQILSDLDFLKSYPDETAAKTAVKEEEVEGYLIVSEEKGLLTATYYGEEGLAFDKKDQVEKALNQAQVDLNHQNAQLSTDQASILDRQPTLKEEIPEGQDMAVGAKIVVIIALVFVVYMMTLTYSVATAQEIAGEKGTKILEIIFSSIPADLYFYGRVLGVVLALFTHLGIYALGGALAYLFLLSQPFGASALPFIQALLAHLNWLLLPFLLVGLTFYVVIAAFCGAIVVRQEDANKAVQPITVLVMVGLISTLIFGQGGQDTLILQVLSYIPGLSIFLMPVRMVNGYVGILEPLLSLSLLLAATVTLAYLIGKSYSGIALQTDDLGLWKSLKKGLASK